MSKDKTCKKCGESKLLEEFYKHPSCKDGRSGSCKACKKSYTATPDVKARQKARNATPQVKAYSKSYRMSRPGYAHAHSMADRARKMGCEVNVCEIMVSIYATAYGDPTVEVDHIIPLSEGGPHCWENLQILSLKDHKHKTLLDAKK